MKLKYVSLSLLLMGMFSCSQDDVLPEREDEKGLEPEVEYFNVHVIYQDKNYYSQCKIEGDKTYVLDEELQAFLDEIETRDYSVIAHNDSTIEYYDSQEELLTKCGIGEVPKSLMTKAGPVAGDLACLELWDDTDFKDTYREFHIKDYNTPIDVTNLKDHGLNDKVSSLKVHNKLSDSNLIALLTVWEDIDFNSGDHDRKKHRMNFVAYSSTAAAAFSNLKKIMCGNSGDSWNDRITSFSFHIGYKNSLPSTY